MVVDAYEWKKNADAAVVFYRKLPQRMMILDYFTSVVRLA
jgi:hypothetical protein